MGTRDNTSDKAQKMKMQNQSNQTFNTERNSMPNSPFGGDSGSL